MLVPSRGSKGKSVPCLSPSFWWLPDTLLFLDLWTHYPSLYLCLHVAFYDLFYPQTSATKCVGFFLKCSNSPRLRTPARCTAPEFSLIPPAVSIRPHRLRAQSHRTVLTSDAIYKSQASRISCQLAINRVLMTLSLGSVIF